VQLELEQVAEKRLVGSGDQKLVEPVEHFDRGLQAERGDGAREKRFESRLELGIEPALPETVCLVQAPEQAEQDLPELGIPSGARLPRGTLETVLELDLDRRDACPHGPRLRPTVGCDRRLARGLSDNSWHLTLAVSVPLHRERFNGLAPPRGRPAGGYPARKIAACPWPTPTQSVARP
jgi:hypothetical protein